MGIYQRKGGSVKEVNRSTVKWIAIITMFIDHTRLTLFTANTQTMAIVRQIIYGIGRLAFPLFVYLLVDGFYRTRSREKFFVRLFIFAALSEVPFDLMRFHKLLSFDKQNVMWTLLFGFGAMWVLEGVRKNFKEKKRLCLLMQVLVSLVAIVFGYMAHSDYGYVGVACVLTVYFCRKAENMFPAGYPIRADMMGYIAAVMLLLIVNEMEIVALLGMLLIWNYHGKPGQRIPMLISYGFYPLHILLLLTAGGLIHPQANIISMLHF